MLSSLKILRFSANLSSDFTKISNATKLQLSMKQEIFQKNFFNNLILKAGLLIDKGFRSILYNIKADEDELLSKLVSMLVCPPLLVPTKQRHSVTL